MNLEECLQESALDKFRVCDVEVLFVLDSAGRDENKVYLARAKQKNMLLNMKYYSSVHLKCVLLS